jgi:hypothetical protein
MRICMANVHGILGIFILSRLKLGLDICKWKNTQPD